MYLAPMLKRPCRLFDRSHSYVTEADPDQSGANGIVAPGSLYSAPVGSTKSPPGMWSPKVVSAYISPPCSISRSEEHTSELQSLMRISHAVFCLKKKRRYQQTQDHDER